MQYKNPILSGYYPDPSICRVGETFYMVCSSFEYFPAVPIFRSTNLVNWEQIGHCVTNDSYLSLEGCGNSKGIYAPTIRYNNGTFYMTTTDVSGIRNFYVTATDPAGPWSEPILTDFPGIDPSFFFDDDGKVYYMSTSPMVNGIQSTLIAEINIETGERLTERHNLWGGSGGQFPEGPHIYKKDGWYYVLLAEGGTAMGHMVTMARSKNIFGPYEAYDNNPIYTHRNLARAEINGTGHMDLVEDQNGNWWAVFLGFRTPESYFHHLGRETFLAPVTWGENEFPQINAGTPTKLVMDAQLPAPVQPVVRSYTDTFDSSELDFRYNILRKHELVRYSLDNGLCIQGNETDLDELGTPTFIGARQTDFNCEVFCSFTADFSDDTHFGITAFYDNTRHFDIYYTADSVVVSKCFDDIHQVCHDVPYNNKDIILYIKAEPKMYYFGYGATEEEARTNIVAQGHTRHLSSEASIMSFTGVYFGIYADNGTKSTAKINYFKYNSQD